MSGTEEHLPLVVHRRVQWAAVVKMAKVTAAALAIITPAILSSWQSYRIAKAELQAKVAEAEARTRGETRKAVDTSLEAGGTYAERLERRIAALEAAQAKKSAGPRKPAKPTPPRPAPPPKSLSAAEAQLKAKSPVVVPLPDAGGQ